MIPRVARGARGRSLLLRRLLAGRLLRDLGLGLGGLLGGGLLGLGRHECKDARSTPSKDGCENLKGPEPRYRKS